MIYLIRHASPVLCYGRCDAATAKRLLDEYNQTTQIDLREIEGFLQQLPLSQPLLSAEVRVLSSPVNRAYVTACRLFGATRVQTDNRLHEYDLRLSRLPFLRIGLKQWFALFRVLWLLGVSLGAASRQDETRRAQGVADELYQSWATTGGRTAVVSHGLFLRTVRKALQKQGMQSREVYRSGCFTVDLLTR
uniref:histidine phosphatase family protein n=1 Tax=Pseudomonas laurentiana TaxID=2364649 RepID=UPI0029C703DD|nr:histidine phosphatase family protein [Pseudomonas laurentiana]